MIIMVIMMTALCHDDANYAGADHHNKTCYHDEFAFVDYVVDDYDDHSEDDDHDNKA